MFDEILNRSTIKKIYMESHFLISSNICQVSQNHDKMFTTSAGSFIF